MNHRNFFHLFILLVFSTPSASIARQQASKEAFGNAPPVIFIIPLVPPDTTYQLPRGYIVQNSETVLLDSIVVLRRVVDYVLDYTSGTLTIRGSTVRAACSDSSKHRVIVKCIPLPFSFERQYSLREAVVRTDSLGRKEVSLVQPGFHFAPEEIFGRGFQKSGTLVRGFTVGSNQDLTLTSGFRMQLNGALSRDIMVTAALTDENSPIQPEGTTQTLREVDKVFINFKARNFEATLGDFNLDIGQKEGGEFGRLFRKLQGANGSVTLEHAGTGDFSTTGSFTAATARGKYGTNAFQGIDGNQGPYRLTGLNGEQQILVLAGTERVYIDGQLMKRGELNDYTVDYGNGDVRFTSYRLITNASRIAVDFEYSDRQYTRNLIAATAGGSALGGKLMLNAVVAQEADDPDSPIDFNLDNTARDVLRQSGSDQFRASLPGVKYVGVDSLGNPKGQYLQKDTVIVARTYRILVYAPGDPAALYSVTFSPVLVMPSDSAGYVKVAGGQFQFAGIGRGNYLPTQFLPMPQLHQSIDVNGKAVLSSDLNVAGEYAATRLDRNRLSDVTTGNEAGSALRFSIQYNPKDVRIFGKNVGTVEASLSERYVDRNFVSLDRFNEVEFGRKWNLSNTSIADEETREATFAYLPTVALRVSGGYGLLNRQGETRSMRTHGEFAVKDSSLPHVDYRVENIRNDDYVGAQNSSWLRQGGETAYRLGHLTPSLEIQTEERRLNSSGKDSLLPGAFRITEIAPKVALQVIGPVSATAEFRSRTEDSSSAGFLQPALRSMTQQYGVQLSGWKDLSSSLALNIRSVKFSDEFKRHGNADGDYILVRSQTHYMPFQRAMETDAYYEFASQRSSRLERVYLRVPKGTGNYVYRGDLNGNGIPDDSEFELTKYDGDYVVIYVPSERLYPVVDLKSSFRLRVQPSRMLRSASNFWERFVKAVSSETFLRVEEQSSDPDPRHIYLLDFRYFQNGQSTISGSSQIQQDLFLFENSQDLSFRFRFNQRDGFVQLVSANERSLLREESVRIRSQLGSEIGNQTDIVEKRDRVAANVRTSRERDIVSDGLITDFSYKPEIQWEIGFHISVSRSVDMFASENTTADINEQGIRITYGLLGTGQARAEFSREEVSLTDATLDPIRGIPFELTNGSAVGKNYLLQLDFDYRINQNVQVSFHYSGRSEGGKSPVHLARAEARAFF